MKQIIISIGLIFISLISYSQELPNFIGKGINEVELLLKEKSYTYSKEINKTDNSKIVLVVTGSIYSKDSLKVINRILKLKFHPNDLCYYSNYINKTTSNNFLTSSPNIEAKSNIQKAGTIGLVGNFFYILGGGIIGIGATSADPTLNKIMASVGGLFTLTGFTLNTLAWNRIRKADSRKR